MRVLTVESLTGMLRRCYEYPNYHGAILFDRNEDKKEFIRTVASQVEGGSVPGIEKITRFGTIKFRNGSEIKAIIAEENKLYGIRVNEVIGDRQYSDDLMRRLRIELYSCENDEDALREDENVCSLDAFLSQFKIL